MTFNLLEAVLYSAAAGCVGWLFTNFVHRPPPAQYLESLERMSREQLEREWILKHPVARNGSLASKLRERQKLTVLTDENLRVLLRAPPRLLWLAQVRKDPVFILQMSTLNWVYEHYEAIALAVEYAAIVALLAWAVYR